MLFQFFPPTCLEYAEPGPLPDNLRFEASTDGYYVIQPASSLSFVVWCDMERDEGGWTLIASGRSFENQVMVIPFESDGSQNEVLHVDLRMRIIDASNHIFRAGPALDEKALYILDNGPILTGARWSSNTLDGGLISCSNSWSGELTEWQHVPRELTCDDFGAGEGDCVDGWMLWFLGDTYNADGSHPCSFGIAAAAPTNHGLFRIWVR